MSVKETPYLYFGDRFEIHKWDDPRMPFIFHTDTYDNFHGFGNWHENLELLLMLEGSGRILCDSREYPMEAGDLIIINSNEVHRIIPNPKMTYHCLIIGGSFCAENGFDASGLKYRTRIRDAEVAARYFSAVTEITAFHGGDKRFSIPAVRSAVLSLLVHLNRRYTEECENAKDRPRSNIIRSALSYINNHFTSPISLDTLARHVGVSKYHFLREFKRYTGYTVVSYINTLRCEYARKLLGEGICSVSEAAARCGYDNLSYFSKTFKLYTGTLPSHYRAKRKEAEAEPII